MNVCVLPTAVGISYISCVVGELLLASVVLLASHGNFKSELCKTMHELRLLKLSVEALD